MIDSSFEVIYLPQVDSTSGYLKRLIREGQLVSNTLCITDQQTQGYGQRARSWLHHEQGVAISYAIALDEPICSTMSAQVAALLHESLSSLSAEKILLKWPNDLFNASGKVAGILLEVAQDTFHKQTFLVVGIGINLFDAPKIEAADYSVGSLAWINVPEFLSIFSQALYHAFRSGKLTKPFSREYWAKHDYFQPNQSVIVYDTDQIKEARYIGLNEQAHLQLEIEDKVVTYHSSRISVRAIKG